MPHWGFEDKKFESWVGQRIGDNSNPIQGVEIKTKEA